MRGGHAGAERSDDKAEPGPVLTAFSYRARALPGGGGRAAGRRLGVGQDRDAAVAQAPRVADAARCLIGDRPVLVSFDCCSSVAVKVFSDTGSLLYSNHEIPAGTGSGGQPGGAEVVGFVSQAKNIGQVLVNEYDHAWALRLAGNRPADVFCHREM